MTKMGKSMGVALGAALALHVGWGAASSTTVTLVATDTAGSWSWNTNESKHWSVDETPCAGKTYVVPNGLTLRTPVSVGPGTFKGDALVLEDGARVNLKQADSTTATANWIMYGSQVAVGCEWTMGVGGTVEVHGTADRPTVFSASGFNGDRAIIVSAALSGESDAVVTMARTKNEDGTYEQDTAKRGYTCAFTGDNSAYKGRFTTTASGGAWTTPWVIRFDSQSALGAPLADAAKVTLADGFILRGGALAFTNGYAVALEGNATFAASDVRADYSDGRYQSAGYEKQYFGRGGTVTGSGASVLTLRADPCVLADATFSGIAKLLATGAVRVHPDYNQPELPVDVQTESILADGSLNVGPVTLRSSSSLQPGFGTAAPQCIGTFGLASLTMEAGSVILLSVAQVDGVYTSDFVRVTGNLVKPAGGTIPVQFDTFPISAPVGTKVALLSAANLGTELTAEDFTVTALDAVTSDLLTGTLTIEEVEGVSTLFFTKTSAAPVSLKGVDGSKADSWASARNWSDKLAPSADKDYIVPSGTLLRRSTPDDDATFKGRSLSITSGGDFAINGLTAVVNDLRLYTGGILTTRNQGDANRLQGTITCNSALYTPFDFEIESPNNGETRTLNLEATLKGTGSLRFRYYKQYVNGILSEEAAVANKGTPTTFYLVTGDNREYRGRMMVCQSSVCVDFKDETAMGGPAETFIPDRLHIARGATLRASRSYAICDPTRGVSFGGGPTTDDGGRIEVVAGATLTISNRIMGTTTLRKRGAGALALCCSTNVFSGVVRNEQGVLAIGAAGAVAQASLLGEAGATWRIDAPEGMTVKSLDAIVENASGTRALTVAPSAFTAASAQTGKIVANLVRFANTEATEENVATALSRVTLDASALGSGWKTEVKAVAADGALLLTATATRRGFTLHLR